MVKKILKLKNLNNLDSTKQVVKEKALEIMNKINKIADYLEIIKDMDAEKNNDLYSKEKSILIILYEHYCNFQKAYINLHFFQMLSHVDKTFVMNIDIKSLIEQIKTLNKKDYELTISLLKNEDIGPINKTYEQLKKSINDLAGLLIDIQSDLIVKEISLIEQTAILEKIKKFIDPSLVLAEIKIAEENYLKFLDENIASKEIFK